MMTNAELLIELESRLKDGDLNAEDVEKLLGRGTNAVNEAALAASTSTTTSNPFGPFSVTKLLYVIGGVFITLGVLYLVSQLWVLLNSYYNLLL
jgi:hypothetical protein